MRSTSRLHFRSCCRLSIMLAVLAGGIALAEIARRRTRRLGTLGSQVRPLPYHTP